MLEYFVLATSTRGPFGMIDDLSVAKTAVFFSIRRDLSDKSIEDLFRSIRAAHGATGNNIFRHTREHAGDTRWSAICFTYERAPAFFDNSTDIVETLCGYVMLVEYQSYVAVFSSRLSIPAHFKTKYLAPVSINRVERAIAKQNAVFQKMRTRNMSISRHAMRYKMVEAADLSNVVGPAGSRRQAPQTYSVDVDGTHMTATPGTGRIALRSDRAGYEEIIGFAKEMIDALRADAGEVSAFLQTFARPMTLADALSVAQPTALGIDTSRLTDAATGDAPAIRIVRAGDNPTQLTTAELRTLIEQLDRPLDIKGDDKLRHATLPDTEEQVASLSLNKTRIALRSLDLPVAATVEVESTAFPLGADPDRQPLYRYLDENGAIIVLFDDVRLAYIDGIVFRDETLRDGGAAFLRYLHVEPSLDGVESEKGEFTAAKTAFDADFTFGVVVNQLAATDTILVCDDLDDEWADFIGLRTDGTLTQITFYHAKAGDLSLGAGQFHIAVSQALKNLGNMTFPAERMNAKVQRWSNLYNNEGHATQISRTIRSNTPHLGEAIAQARSAPEAIRRAVIVTSSLSKQAVTNVLNNAQNGVRLRPSFVQMYWLLQSFFSDCAEAGVSGSIVCRP